MNESLDAQNEIKGEAENLQEIAEEQIHFSKKV